MECEYLREMPRIMHAPNLMAYLVRESRDSHRLKFSCKMFMSPTVGQDSFLPLLYI
mgnify:CR=1 FL=1